MRTAGFTKYCSALFFFLLLSLSIISNANSYPGEENMNCGSPEFPPITSSPIKSIEQFLEDLGNQVKDIPDESDKKSFIYCYVDRYMKHLSEYINKKFPAYQEGRHRSGNPLGNLADFYQASARRNSFGIGYLFSLEWFNWPFKRSTVYEAKQERIIAGVNEDKIYYKDRQEFNGYVRVFRQVIRNDKVIFEQKKRDGFSFLHDLPSMMRKGGENQVLIDFTQELIYLVNFHLWKNYYIRGLDMPADHPQLALPESYTPAVFRRNFTALLLKMVESKQL